MEVRLGLIHHKDSSTRAEDSASQEKSRLLLVALVLLFFDFVVADTILDKRLPTQWSSRPGTRSSSDVQPERAAYARVTLLSLGRLRTDV
ncbi:MAG: hypothetical protein LC808_33055 [Actinobacteria bacterium]|nr:hypothetical protein [Actinomycetota bacterium]